MQIFYKKDLKIRPEICSESDLNVNLPPVSADFPHNPSKQPCRKPIFVFVLPPYKVSVQKDDDFLITGHIGFNSRVPNRKGVIRTPILRDGFPFSLC